MGRLERAPLHALEGLLRPSTAVGHDTGTVGDELEIPLALGVELGGVLEADQEVAAPGDRLHSAGDAQHLPGVVGEGRRVGDATEVFSQATPHLEDAFWS